MGLCMPNYLPPCMCINMWGYIWATTCISMYMITCIIMCMFIYVCEFQFRKCLCICLYGCAWRCKYISANMWRHVSMCVYGLLYKHEWVYDVDVLVYGVWHADDMEMSSINVNSCGNNSGDNNYCCCIIAVGSWEVEQKYVLTLNLFVYTLVIFVVSLSFLQILINWSQWNPIHSISISCLSFLCCSVNRLTN